MNRKFLFAVLVIGVLVAIGFVVSQAQAVNTPSAEVYQPGQTAGPTMQNAKVDPSPVDRGKAVTISVTASDVSGINTAVANIKNSTGTTLAIVQLYDDGRHSDGTAGDGAYANTWNVGTIVDGQYPIEIQLADALGHPTIKPAALTIIVGTGFNNVNTYCYQNFCNTAPSDSTPPTVSVTAPASGATVTGSVSVTANAADNIGVSGVQFKLDGANLGAEDTAAPYSVSWDSTTTSNGSHALTAVARDAAANTTTATAVTVTVSNVTTDTTPPTVAITTPATDGTALATASYNVVANATDAESSITKVEFYLDAETSPRDTQSVDQPAGSHNYTWVLNVGSLTTGNHTLKAIAYNGAALTAPAARTVNVTYTSTAPTNVSITSPTSGTFDVASVINVVVHAQDDVDISRIEVYSSAGGGPINTITVPGAADTSVDITVPITAGNIAMNTAQKSDLAVKWQKFHLPFISTAEAATSTTTSGTCTTTTTTNPKAIYAVAYDATLSTSSGLVTYTVSSSSTTCTGTNATQLPDPTI